MSSNSNVTDPIPEQKSGSKCKRHRSGDQHAGANEQKRKKMVHDDKVHSGSSIDFPDIQENETVSTKSDVGEAKQLLPLETPDWGIKLLEVIQAEFKKVTSSNSTVDAAMQGNT